MFVERTSFRNREFLVCYSPTLGYGLMTFPSLSLILPPLGHLLQNISEFLPCHTEYENFHLILNHTTTSQRAKQPSCYRHLAIWFLSRWFARLQSPRVQNQEETGMILGLSKGSLRIHSQSNAISNVIWDFLQNLFPIISLQFLLSLPLTLLYKCLTLLV